MAWHKHIPIADLLEGDAGPDHLRRAAVGLQERLKETTAPMHLINLSLTLSDAGDHEGARALFDSGLTAIYDWADTNRVWLGGNADANATA